MPTKTSSERGRENAFEPRDCDDVCRPFESVRSSPGFAAFNVRRRWIPPAEGAAFGIPRRENRADPSQVVVNEAVDAMNSEHQGLSTLYSAVS